MVLPYFVRVQPLSARPVVFLRPRSVAEFGAAVLLDKAHTLLNFGILFLGFLNSLGLHLKVFLDLCYLNEGSLEIDAVGDGEFAYQYRRHEGDEEEDPQDDHGDARSAAATLPREREALRRWKVAPNTQRGLGPRLNLRCEHFQESRLGLLEKVQRRGPGDACVVSDVGVKQGGRRRQQQPSGGGASNAESA